MNVSQICTDAVADDTLFKQDEWVAVLYGKQDTTVSELDNDTKVLEFNTVMGRLGRTGKYFYADECPKLAESLGVEATPCYLQYGSALMVYGTVNEQQLYAFIATGAMP